MSKPKKPIEVSSRSFPVSYRLVLKKTFIPFLFFLASCLVLGRNLAFAWWLVGAIFLMVLIIALTNYLYLKVLYYHLEDDYLLIKRHAITPLEVVIEYNRIKDIVIYRDLLDRLFGLYQVRFVMDLTSPTAVKMSYIEGLDEVESHELKVVMEHLMEKAVRHHK